MSALAAAGRNLSIRFEEKCWKSLRCQNPEQQTCCPTNYGKDDAIHEQLAQMLGAVAFVRLRFQELRAILIAGFDD